MSCQRTRLEGWLWVLAPWFGLGLVPWTALPHACVAQTPSPSRILEAPMTLPALHVSESTVDPASEEIWISSDTPETDGTLPEESKPEIGTRGQPDVKPTTRPKPDLNLTDGPGPSDAPAPKLPVQREASQLDAAPSHSGLRVPNLLEVPQILRFREPVRRVPDPELRRDEADLPGPQDGEIDSASQPGLTLRTPELFSSPELPHLEPFPRGPRQLKSPAGWADVPARRAESSPESSAADQGSKHAQIRPLGATGSWTSVRKGDEYLFHTTSAPVKKASSVFRPKRDPSSGPLESSSGKGVSVALRVPKGPIESSSGKNVSVALRVPKGPINVPDNSSYTGQAVQVSEQPAAEGQAEVRGESRLTVQEDRKWQPPLAQTAAVLPTAQREDPSALPATLAGATDRSSDRKQVFLRVQFAEVKRPATPSLGSDLDLRSSAESPLVHSLLQPHARDAVTVLKDLDRQAIESALRSLEEQGRVRTRGTATLATTSGKAVTFITEGDVAEPFDKSGDPGANEAAGLHATVTLRPTLTDAGHIELELASKCRLSGPQRADGARPKATNRTIETKVRMRDGETLVMGGWLKNSGRRGQAGSVSVIERMLNLPNTDRRETELVMLVTPVSAQSTGPERPVWPASFDLGQPDKTPPLRGGFLVGRPERGSR